MNLKSLSCCSVIAFASVGAMEAQTLLFDINAEAHSSGSPAQLWLGSASNPAGVYLATTQDFADAGVAGDLSGAVVLHGSKQNNNNNSIAAGGISIDISFPQGPPNAIARPWVDTSTFDGDGTSNLFLQDYVYLDGSHGLADTHLVAQIDISGLAAYLNPDSAYYLYLFGAGDIPNEGAAFTFGGLTLETPLDAPPAREDERFARFTFTTGAVVADSFAVQWDRQLDLDGSDLRFTAFNGFAITPVPEPSTFALLGAGGLAFLAWRRFRA